MVDHAHMGTGRTTRAVLGRRAEGAIIPRITQGWGEGVALAAHTLQDRGELRLDHQGALVLPEGIADVGDQALPAVESRMDAAIHPVERYLLEQMARRSPREPFAASAGFADDGGIEARGMAIVKHLAMGPGAADVADGYETFNAALKRKPDLIEARRALGRHISSRDRLIAPRRIIVGR